MSWTFSCRKVTELMSRSLDEPLELLDRIRLRVHLSKFGNCRNVERRVVQQASAGALTEIDRLPGRAEAPLVTR